MPNAVDKSFEGLDENGFPVLLAAVPGSGVARVDANAKSGNPLHDTRSGKFGSGGPPKRTQLEAPANVDPLDFKRMLDAARDVARQYGDPSEDDIREYLDGRAKNPEAVDIAAFLNEVRNERLNDVVDLLDQQFKGKKGKGLVKISAGRAALKRAIRGLNEDDLAEVLNRLEAMGHKAEDLDTFFDGRIDGPVREKAIEKRNGIQASDNWGTPDLDLDYTLENDEPNTDMIEMAEIISRNIQPPVIHVNPQITVEAKPTRKEIVRDEKGLVSGVIDVEE